MGREQWRLVMTAACLAATGTAHAAGGHHAVDDAAILGEGECELEAWGSRFGAGARLLHAGLNCRVGPVELGAASEYGRDGGASSTGWALQAKWARELGPVSVGLSVQPLSAAHVRPRYAGTVVAALLSWQAAEPLALHFNLGRDLVHRGRDQARGGVGVEWTPASGWSLAAERYREQDTHFLRAGVRWNLAKAWTLDASHAHRISGPNPSLWTVGVTYGFGGD
jgi:hypothetical protein